MGMFKRCSCCKVTKPIEEFYRKRAKPDGHQCWCKVCAAEKDRRYGASHRSIRNATLRLWRTANPDKAREHKVRYDTAHADQKRESLRRWRHQNPEKVLDMERRRRARKRDAPIVERFDAHAIYKRDGWRCHICKKKVAKKQASLDHLIPLSQGGSHTSDNVALAHRRCNSKRGPGRIPAQLRLVG